MTCYRHSTVQDPVRRVHELYRSNKSLTRLEFIAMCEREGINPNTASTQYNVAKNHPKRVAKR